MFSCLLIALAFAAPWSINTIFPMTSVGLFSRDFPGDESCVREVVGPRLIWRPSVFFKPITCLLHHHPPLYLFLHIYICLHTSSKTYSDRIMCMQCLSVFVFVSSQLMQHVCLGKRACPEQLAGSALCTVVCRLAQCMATISANQTILLTLDSKRRAAERGSWHAFTTPECVWPSTLIIRALTLFCVQFSDDSLVQHHGNV